MPSGDGTRPSRISLVIANPHGLCNLDPDEHHRMARIAANGTVRLTLPEAGPVFPMVATLEVGGETPSTPPSPRLSQPPDVPVPSGSSDVVHRVCDFPVGDCPGW
ncbi:hypothetical protein GSI_11868 [Ganoderma sinense ZZ0214-1]|uniref:Uncharacterized protein n=1 Tax=Ganoderma sinense ZZ0214-1 TaxID=1077348 RepID=A0A2G8RX97_9APHY|nr:hypothetical protein GSI_11868 [Ganoderma sinense ZZ0214-1]